MSEEIKSNEEVENTAPAAPEAAGSAGETAEPAKSESSQGERPQGDRPQGDRPQGDRPQGNRPQGGRPPYQRNPRFKRKVCKFCHDKNLQIDYKNAALLEQFITDRGKILPRRVTGTCAKHQRGVALAIKRARILALLPFVEK